MQQHVENLPHLPVGESIAYATWRHEAQPTPSTTFRLLDLPTEIRSRISGLFFGRRNIKTLFRSPALELEPSTELEHRIRAYGDLALLLVSRRIFTEASDILWDLTMFRIYVGQCVGRYYEDEQNKYAWLDKAAWKPFPSEILNKMKHCTLSVLAYDSNAPQIESLVDLLRVLNRAPAMKSMELHFCLNGLYPRDSPYEDHVAVLRMPVSSLTSSLYGKRVSSWRDSTKHETRLTDV